MQKAIMKIIFEEISTKLRKIQLMVQQIITSRPLQQSNQVDWLWFQNLTHDIDVDNDDDN